MTREQDTENEEAFELSASGDLHLENEGTYQLLCIFLRFRYTYEYYGKLGISLTMDLLTTSCQRLFFGSTDLEGQRQLHGCIASQKRSDYGMNYMESHVPVKNSKFTHSLQSCCKMEISCVILDKRRVW